MSVPPKTKEITAKMCKCLNGLKFDCPWTTQLEWDLHVDKLAREAKAKVDLKHGK